MNIDGYVMIKSQSEELLIAVDKVYGNLFEEGDMLPGRVGEGEIVFRSSGGEDVSVPEMTPEDLMLATRKGGVGICEMNEDEIVKAAYISLAAN